MVQFLFIYLFIYLSSFLLLSFLSFNTIISNKFYSTKLNYSIYHRRLPFQYRKYNKCDLPENGHLVQFQHMDRHQVGYLMSQNLKKRRKTKVKTFDNNGQEIHPSGQPSVTPESGMTSDTRKFYSFSFFLS